MKAATAALAIGACAAALSGCAQVQKVRNFRTRADVVTQPACTNMTFPIYFQSGSDQLTAAALEAINASSAQVRACRVAEVAVTGLADAEGSAQRNLELSRRRATVVAAALTARGYPTPTFDIEAAGEAGAATALGAAPMRRMTEVSVRFAPGAPTGVKAN